MKKITQAQALEFLQYVPETGHLIWIKKASDKTNVGARAGWQRSIAGYRQVGLFGSIYYEHRLIWLMVNGGFPENQIGHINGIKDDNRYANLRHVTSSQNITNIGAKRDNTSGTKNVHWCNRNRRWIAKVKIDGHTHHAGSFADYESAVKAATAARIAFHGEFASHLGHERDACMVAWPYRRAAK